MRTILAMLMALLLLGSAEALPLWGPAQGFRTPGTIEVGGDLSVTGSISTGGANITNGVIQDDLVMSGGKDFTANAGDGLFDWSLATGMFNTSTGANYINGNVTIASGMTVTSTNTITAEQLTSTDDALITDDLVVDGAARIDETATVNALVVNTTATVPGLTTLSTLALGINATTSISTTLTASDTRTIYPMDGSGGHVTLTLPDAATNAGRIYMIVMAADMGGNNVIVDTTGAANLGGATGPDSLTTTDGYFAALTVVSDGTNYLVINKDATWS